MNQSAIFENLKEQIFENKQIDSEEAIRLKETLTNAVCSQNNPCALLCANKKCSGSGIVCSKPSCGCQLGHKKSLCTKIQPEDLIEGFVKPTFLHPEFIKYLEETLDKLIQIISDIANRLKPLSESIGRTDTQKQFISLIDTQEFHKINGSMVARIHAQIEDFNESVDKQKFQDSLEFDWVQKIKQINSEVFSLEDLFGFRQYSQYKKQIQQSLTQPLSSEIVQNKADIYKLIGMFDRKVSHFQLLYRASVNGFEVKKFHECCDSIEDTVLLVRSEYGKVFGGYTPIPWKSPNNNSFGNSTANTVSDPSHRSFLFSITENDKFPMKPVINTLLHSSNYGPVFRGPNKEEELHICNSSNVSRESECDVGRNFCNPRYSHDLRQNRKRFSGSLDGKFFIQEWEVFKVVFANQSEVNEG